MPYIPQFNKMSLQEMSYAPTLMRQQHDDAVAKQMELAEALKFDYLKQDAEGIEPVLQDYNKNIENISKQISQQGFSHDLKNKVMGLRSKYVGDDKIRTYKKNYADAMSQWDEQRKRMIQEGRPGYDINAQKEAFFSGYKGAYNEDGLKNEFTSGKTSGYYDIGEDASKLMSNLGMTETPIIGSSGSIRRVKDGNDYYFEVRNARNGSVTKNKDQIFAIKQYLKNEYRDDSTDRGLFKKINKLDDNYIDNVIDRIGEAKSLYKEEAIESNVGASGFGSKDQDPYEKPLPTYQNAKVDSDQYKTAQEREDIITGKKKVTRKATREELKGVESSVDVDNPYLTTDIEIKPQEAIDDQKKLTPRYFEMYKGKINPSTQKEYTDAEIAVIGTKAVKNASAYLDERTGINIDKRSLSGFTPAYIVLRYMLNPSNEAPLIETGGKMLGGDKKISVQDFMNSIQDTDNKGASWEDAPVEFGNDGEILLHDFKGKEYKVDTKGENGQSVMEKSTGVLYNNLYVPILKKITSFNLHDDPQLEEPILAPDGNIYDVVTPPDADPYDPSNRMIRIRTQNPSDEPYYMTQQQFKNSFLKQSISGLKNVQVNQ